MKKIKLMFGVSLFLFLTTVLFTSCITAMLMALGESTNSNYSESSYNSSTTAVDLVNSFTRKYEEKWTVQLYEDGAVKIYNSYGNLKIYIDCVSFSDAQRLYSYIVSEELYCNTVEEISAKVLKNCNSTYRNGYVYYDNISFK